MKAPTIEERFETIELQCRYGDAVDRRDWDAFLTCFAADATSDVPRTGRHANPQVMVAAVRDVVERLDATQHHLTNHRLQRIGDVLHASCYVLAEHVRNVGGMQRTYAFGGRYTDVLTTDPAGSLVIAHRQLEIIWAKGDPRILHP